jgi:hypothetical protein
MKPKNSDSDRRPDPKPRKLAHLWQAYMIWYELVQMRKCHILRISSIEKGKSNLDRLVETAFLEDMQLDYRIKTREKQMIEWGKMSGPIWQWITSIRGLKSGSLAAQLLAQIDDIGKFATVSKLWRFAGMAVIDGHREYGKKGEKSHYNKLLAATCWILSDEFVKQQTPLYAEIYYEEKARLRRLYPEPIPNLPDNGSKWKEKFTDSHVDRMAKRKTVKIFLSHLWLKWREYEGLPVSDPYAIAIMKHTNIIEPEML